MKKSVGGGEIPEGTRPSAALVRLDSHVGNSGSDPAGDRTRFALVFNAIGPRVMKNPEPIRNTQQNEGPAISFRCDSNRPWPACSPGLNHLWPQKEMVVKMQFQIILHNAVFGPPTSITASEGEDGAARGVRGRGKLEIPERASRPAASSDAIFICENPGVARPGIEPGSPWWRASGLSAQLPRPHSWLQRHAQMKRNPLRNFASVYFSTLYLRQNWLYMGVTDNEHKAKGSKIHRNVESILQNVSGTAYQLAAVKCK
ncbi:hypothetical protein PR048_022935 [Dryococelus australis]|uniref:Uncharacterized protein n=1 Tax=Dryococelus australis TaxID=614101 RepID=A0ABQ9GSP1_9NEOP|nr:hypothetical protein PR048_022935 [Dryococelus australis]